MKLSRRVSPKRMTCLVGCGWTVATDEPPARTHSTERSSAAGSHGRVLGALSLDGAEGCLLTHDLTLIVSARSHMTVRYSAAAIRQDSKKRRSRTSTGRALEAQSARNDRVRETRG